MTYWYATPKQRSANFSIYSKAKKISDIGPALANTNSVFTDSLEDGDMIYDCKKIRSGMELIGIYKYSNGTITKQDDFMCSMFQHSVVKRTDMNDLFDTPAYKFQTQ